MTEAPSTVPHAHAANPAALGLMGLGITSVLLNLVTAGVLPAAGAGVVMPLALTYGGTIQLIAGVFEFRLGNTFGMTAFLSYGAFWLWFALLQIFAHAGMVDVAAAGPTTGVALLLWGVVTLALWIGSFALPRIVFLVFLFGWLTLFLSGIGGLAGSVALSRLGGWLGIASGVCAIYGSLGIIANAAAGRRVVPLGER